MSTSSGALPASAHLAITNLLVTLASVTHQWAGSNHSTSTGVPAVKETRVVDTFCGRAPVPAAVNLLSTPASVNQWLEDISHLASTGASAIRPTSAAETSAAEHTQDSRLYVFQLDMSPELADPQTALTSLNCELSEVHKLAALLSAGLRSILPPYDAVPEFCSFEDDVALWLCTIETQATEQYWTLPMTLAVAKSKLRDSARAWYQYDGWHRADWGDWCGAIVEALGDSLMLTCNQQKSDLAMSAARSRNLSQMWDTGVYC